jgi:hypothetical protein
MKISEGLFAYLLNIIDIFEKQNKISGVYYYY